MLKSSETEPHTMISEKYGIGISSAAVKIQIGRSIVATPEFFTDRFPNKRGELVKLYQAQERVDQKSGAGMISQKFITWRLWKSAPYDFKIRFMRYYLMPGKVLPGDPAPDDAGEEPPERIDWRTHDPMTTDLFTAGYPGCASGTARIGHKHNMAALFLLLQMREMLVHVLRLCHAALLAAAQTEDALIMQQAHSLMQAQHQILEVSTAKILANNNARIQEATCGEVEKTALLAKSTAATTALSTSKTSLENPDVHDAAVVKFWKQYPQETLDAAIQSAEAGSHDNALCAAIRVWEDLPAVYKSSETTFNTVYLRGGGVWFNDTTSMHTLAMADFGEMLLWGELGAKSLVELSHKEHNRVAVNHLAKHALASRYVQFVSTVLYSGFADEPSGSGGEERDSDVEEEECEARTCQVYTCSMYDPNMQSTAGGDPFQPPLKDELAALANVRTRVVVLTSPPWGYDLSEYDKKPNEYQLEVKISFLAHNIQYYELVLALDPLKCSLHSYT
jgi:hypothetical protein